MADLNKKSVGLGDLTKSALSSVGITEARVEAWLGSPCHCEERRAKLNALGIWLKRWTSGKIKDAKKYLEQIMSD